MLPARLALLTLAILLAGCALPATDPTTTGAPTTAAPTTGATTSPGTGSPGAPVRFRVLETGTSSGIEAEGYAGRIVRDQAAWEAFWAEHKSRTSEPGTPPAVNFSHETVAAVFLGQRPSSGYAIEVANVTFNYNSVRIHTAATEPGDDCGTLAVLTQPFQIVAINSRYTGIGGKPEDAFSFFNPEMRTHNCA